MNRQHSTLTPEQQIFLRVILSDTPIRTILHGERMHEVIRQSAPLRLVQPWFESDGTASDSVSYWVPFCRNGVPTPTQAQTQSRRKVLFASPCWVGEPRPKGRSVKLKSRFPSAPYLKRLVSELGYDKRAAMACMPQSYTRFLRADGRYTGGRFGKERQQLAGQPLYLGSEIRHTTQGGSFKAATVVKVIARHNWGYPYPYAVFRTVSLWQKTDQVAKELGINPGTLYVYSNQIRKELMDSPDICL